MNRLPEDDFASLLPYIPEPEAWRGTAWFITGGTGMLGSYVLRFLGWLNETRLDRTMSVTAVHRGELGPDHPNIGCLWDRPCIRFVRMDLRETRHLDLDGYDYVIHAASNAAPASYMDDPIGTINSNAAALQAMLEGCKGKARLQKFVFVSSGEIYGDPDAGHVPTGESYIGATDHLSPRSCYVESKRFGETLCAAYARVHRIPITVVRPVHIFGPGFRPRDGRAWADFIGKAADGRDIDIWSDGTARRGFCYLADALSQLFAVVQKGAPGEAYNIGSDESVSIKDFAGMVAACAEQPVQVHIRNRLPDYMIGSPRISCPAIAKVSALSPR